MSIIKTFGWLIVIALMIMLFVVRSKLALEVPMPAPVYETYVVISAVDNIADTVVCTRYVTKVYRIPGTGTVSFYNSIGGRSELVAMYTFSVGSPLIVKRIYEIH